MEIYTTPPGASVTIGDGLVTCISPCREPLKAEIPLTVSISLPGHSEYRGSISRTISTYFWINALLYPTGLLGMGLDYLTDSMWTWENFYVTMVALEGDNSNTEDEEDQKEDTDESRAKTSPSKEASEDVSESPSQTPSETMRKDDVGSSSEHGVESKPRQESTPSAPIAPEATQENSKSSHSKPDPKPLPSREDSPKAKYNKAASDSERAITKYPRLLVIRRLEWHMGALSENDLNAKIPCIYRILESHQGGSDFDLDMAIKMLMERHQDHCD